MKEHIISEECWCNPIIESFEDDSILIIHNDITEDEVALMNSAFVESFRTKQKEVHANAVNKGFWEVPSEDGTLLALIHAEVSEALEAIRKGNPPDKHLPIRDSFSVELADIVIRVMDLAEYYKIDLGKIIEEKMGYNKDRPYKHGGKAF